MLFVVFFPCFSLFFRASLLRSFAQCFSNFLLTCGVGTSSRRETMPCTHCKVLDTYIQQIVSNCTLFTLLFARSSPPCSQTCLHFQIFSAYLQHCVAPLHKRKEFTALCKSEQPRTPAIATHSSFVACSKNNENNAKTTLFAVFPVNDCCNTCHF